MARTGPGDGGPAEGETRKRKKLCETAKPGWEPRKPHCRVETLLNKESQLLITRERFYIHRFLGSPAGICQTFQPITLPARGTMDNT